MSDHSIPLALADGTGSQLPPGVLISAILLFSALTGSIVMLVVWGRRLLQTGHLLPRADRGLLPVPRPLLAFGAGLACLICVLAVSSLLLPAETPSTDSDGLLENGENSTARETPSPDSRNSEENSESSTSDPAVAVNGDHVSDGSVIAAIVQTIVLDVLLFCLFGSAVLIASLQGRARLPAVCGYRPSSAGMIPTDERGKTGLDAQRGRSELRAWETAWPDLDADSEAIVISDNPFLVRMSETSDAADSGTSVSGTLSASDDGRPGSADNPDGEEAFVLQTPSAVSESYSYLRELRYAAEVFLAAYLPTTVLRLIMIKVVFLYTGEDAESHPFLEMLEDGVTWQTGGLILLMAVGLAPLVEELFYRVVILGGIVQTGRVGSGLVASSVLFCCAHGFPDSIALLPLAFALGYTYIRRQSYRTVMMVHFLFNGFNMLIAGASLL